VKIDTRALSLVATIVSLSMGVVWGAPDDPVVERESNPKDQQRNFVFGRNQIDFNQYVFSSVGTVEGRNDWRGYARQWLDLELETLARDCEVSPQQLKEIELGFEGELARFDVLYREAKAKWDELKKKDNNEFDQQIWQIISPLQSVVQSHWMHESSLARRTIRSVLSKEQLAKYDDSEKARQVFANQTGLSLAITLLDEAIPMTGNQREEVEKLLAPKMKVDQVNQGYIWVGGLTSHLAQIPVKNLEPIFKPDQWKRLDVELKPHRPQVRIQGGFKLFGR
jgi:hypothetical protein